MQNPFRPCGQCRSLVDIREGCIHWRPQSQNPDQRKIIQKNNRAAAKRYRARKRAASLTSADNPEMMNTGNTEEVQ